MHLFSRFFDLQHARQRVACLAAAVLLHVLLGWLAVDMPTEHSWSRTFDPALQGQLTARPEPLVWTAIATEHDVDAATNDRPSLQSLRAWKPLQTRSIDLAEPDLPMDPEIQDVQSPVASVQVSDSPATWIGWIEELRDHIDRAWQPENPPQTRGALFACRVVLLRRQDNAIVDFRIDACNREDIGLKARLLVAISSQLPVDAPAGLPTFVTEIPMHFELGGVDLSAFASP